MHCALLCRCGLHHGTIFKSCQSVSLARLVLGSHFSTLHSRDYTGVQRNTNSHLVRLSNVDQMSEDLKFIAFSRLQV